MLDLRERAHASLDEYQRGKGSPASRYGSSTGPISPDTEHDELSVLGGKPRLNNQKEPSSPSLAERSPLSLNPIVPLPLSPNLQHPYIIEYLDSFNHRSMAGHEEQQPVGSGTANGSYAQAPGSATTQSSFSEMELSPVSMYGMSSVNSNTFTSEPSSYGGQQQSMHGLMESNTRRQETQLPQYFPVYDYGTTANYNSNNTAFASNMVLDPNPAPGHRRSSGSPQADPSMHSTWIDFVNGLTLPQTMQ